MCAAHSARASINRTLVCIPCCIICQPDLFLPSQYTGGSFIRAGKKVGEELDHLKAWPVMDVSQNIEATKSLPAHFLFVFCIK